MKTFRTFFIWVLLSILVITPARGQKQNNIWYFGNHAGLDFSIFFPFPLADGQINTPEGVASVSDSTGRLLFYTDGVTVWDSTHQIMNPYNPLKGDPSSTHSATILPNPNNPKQYYIFTTPVVNNQNPDYTGLDYYLVDFTGNPLGEVIPQTATGLLLRPTEKLAVTPFDHPVYGPTYRLISHQFANDSFARTYLCRLDTLIFQSIGATHRNSTDDDGTNHGAAGQMKFSLQGDKLAVAIEGQKRVDLFRVDQATGALWGHMILPAGDPNIDKKGFIHDAYGVEFSPTGNYLYGTSRKGGLIYQWDLGMWVEDRMQATVQVISYDNEVEYGALQLAPNGKIYVAVNGKDYLSVINSPMHFDCRFEKYGARLINNANGEGGTSGYGLPVAIPGTLKAEPFYFEHTCYGDQTYLYVTSHKGWAGTPFWTIFNEAGEQIAVINSINEEGEYRGWYRFPGPGNYCVVMNGFRNGNPVTYTRYITIHPIPEVHLAPKDTMKLCIGEEMHLDAGIGAFYEWENTELKVRERDITTTDNLIDLYRVKLTDYNGCVGWDTLWTWKKSPPQVEITSTKALCGDNNGTITVTPAGNLNDYIFTWEEFPDSSGNHLTGLPPGMYHVHVYSVKIGCSVTKEIEVQAFGGPNVKISASDTIVCPGAQVTLTVTGATEFFWLNPAGITDSVLTVYPEQTTTYRVNAIAREGDLSCETIATRTIRVWPVTRPDLGDDLTACEGDTVPVVLTGNWEQIEWNSNFSGANILVTTSYNPLIVSVTDQHQCITTDTLQITFYPLPDVDLGKDTTLCSNEGYLLTGGSGDQYLWSTGDTSPTIEARQSGFYWLQITERGCAMRDTINLVLHHPDSLQIRNVSVRDVSCNGGTDGSISIQAVGEGLHYLYSVDNGINWLDNNGLFDSLPASTDYRIRVWEDSSCMTVYPNPVLISEPDSIQIRQRLTPPECAECTDGSIEITLITGGTPPYMIDWSNGDADMITENLPVGTYTVTITDKAGCQYSRDFELDMKHAVPNAFTPNGDGINDLWVINLLEYYPDATVWVYDSSGKMVYQALLPAFNNPWNGNDLNGDPVPAGTYYYIIRLDNIEPPLTGHLTILR
ncbi:MAG: gliding motility-associated C-terminal domain-containing protein [Bacteroidales bacterium]|nr:gliding motility-associated C-terminal domain-containing protein [Bacteroidales bacterium]